MAEIILVTGGARSGKSKFAENYAERYGNKIAYIATARILDEEMRFRVEMHQQRRPAGWHTFEAPDNAHTAINEASNAHDMILFDCITIYLSNIIFSLPELDDEKEIYKIVQDKISRLIDSARKSRSTVIFVTNEVGCCIVPENKLARHYRDLAGMANQMLAAAADKVYLAVSGIAVDIRKLGEII